MKAFVIDYGGKDIVCHDDPAQALRWWLNWMTSTSWGKNLDTYLAHGLTVREADYGQTIRLETSLERPNDTRTIAQLLQEKKEPGVIATAFADSAIADGPYNLKLRPKAEPLPCTLGDWMVLHDETGSMEFSGTEEQCKAVRDALNLDAKQKEGK